MAEFQMTNAEYYAQGCLIAADQDKAEAARKAFLRCSGAVARENYRKACMELARTYMLVGECGRTSPNWRPRYIRTAMRWIQRAEHLRTRHTICPVRAK